MPVSHFGVKPWTTFPGKTAEDGGDGYGRISPGDRAQKIRTGVGNPSDVKGTQSSRVIVTGGRQRRDALDQPEWFSFKSGLAIVVDLETGDVRPLVEYVTRAELCPAEQPSTVFKAGSIKDHQLYVCTQTEILRYSLADFSRTGHWSYPWLNDVHHVLPKDDGGLLVANTGLDQVLELSQAGDVLGQWSFGAVPTWERFDPGTDYRRVATTKPHDSHPNFLFESDGHYWVTRFEQKDAVALDAPDLRMAIDQERPHDGIVRDHCVYFTTVDGHVIVFDASSRRRKRIIDLNTLVKSSDSLGWCRGLHIPDDRHAWVGFSRFRPTKFREAVSWVKHGFEKVGTYAMAPTRIALFDLKDERLIREIDLEPAGLNAVFSILPFPDWEAGAPLPSARK